MTKQRYGDWVGTHCDYCFGVTKPPRDICVHLKSREMQVAVFSRYGVWSPARMAGRSSGQPYQQEQLDLFRYLREWAVEQNTQIPLQTGIPWLGIKAQLGKPMILLRLFTGMWVKGYLQEQK